MLRIFSQTKEDLDKKIQYHMYKDEYISPNEKEMLMNWMKWYDRNNEKFILDTFTNNLYYRVYFENPEIFGIQIWEETNLIHAWHTNKYVNIWLEDNDDTTILI